MPKLMVTVWSEVDVPEEGTPEYDQLVRLYEEVTDGPWEPFAFESSYKPEYALAYLLVHMDGHAPSEFDQLVNHAVNEIGTEYKEVEPSKV
jgi:hypothetical protein